MVEDLEQKLREQELEADLEKQKDDVCPYCGLRTEKFPYLIWEPMHGWLECPGCGIIFSPLSIRRQKMEKLLKKIEVPKLVVPAAG